jgi:hypothetical protein
MIAMRRVFLIVGLAGLLSLVVAGLTAWSMHRWAIADVPAYSALLEASEGQGADLVAGRDRFESQLAASISESQSQPAWRWRLVADDLNAWFATRLADELPAYAEGGGFQDPRVVIGQSTVVFFARATIGRVAGIATVELCPRVTERGELALELASTKLGSLALPTAAVVEHLRQSPLDSLRGVRWVVGETTSTLVLDPAQLPLDADPPPTLASIDLRPGELLLSGGRLDPARSSAAPQGNEPEASPPGETPGARIDAGR